jgi:hypothetical protein
MNKKSEEISNNEDTLYFIHIEKDFLCIVDV